MRGVAACVLAATGCGPLADNTYRGEPMMTLEGSFTETGQPFDVDAQLALLWQDAATATGPGVEVTPIPYSATSLGRFVAEIPVPPPLEARFAFDDGGPALAEAYVHVVTGVPLAMADMDLGLDPVHVVVFAEADVAGGAAADYLGGPITAGYHLRQFTTATPGAAQRELIERCVAATGNRIACEGRRGYQLVPIDDADPLRVVLRVR